MTTTISPVSAPAAPPLRPTRQRHALLLIPALIALAVFFVLPIVVICVRAFTDPDVGFENFTWFFSSEANVNGLVRTFSTALWVTVVALVLSFPYAFGLTIAGPKLRTLLLLLVMLPFWTSLLVRTFAWVILLQDSGLVNDSLSALGLPRLELIRTTTGVVIAMVQVLMPFMVLPLYATLLTIDRRLMLAARGMGAKPVTAFFTVYLPLALPGIGAGCLLVFITSLGFYITPALLGAPDNAMFSQQIFTQVNGLLQWGRGGAMAVILLGCTLVLLALAGLILRRSKLGGLR